MPSALRPTTDRQMEMEEMAVMLEHEERLHPRPQFARDHWTDLRGSWGFCYDDADRGRDEGWQSRDEVFGRTITVPFPPESPASGIGDTAYHPRLWYRSTFPLAEIQAGERVLLHFGAVDYRADIWVDDRHVIAHEGGHTPFSVDITPALSQSTSHKVVVRAEDDPLDMAQPRGKQDWQPEPHTIFYHRTSGIWQPVWVEVVGPAYLADLRWTPDLTRGVLGLSATIHRHGDLPLRARIQLSMHGEPLADDVCLVRGTSLQREFAVDAAAVGHNGEQWLWTPDHPNLIDATISLLAGDVVVDTIRSYAGMRSVGAEHGRFWLNGSPIFLRLALEQGYWPESHLAAPSDDALRDEVELAKSLGFNGVRIHQKVEDPRFLYWCDRLGLLVWGEMPSAFVFTQSAMERLTREWLEVLRRDFSHPCIIAWVPLNESWGVPNLRDDPAQRSYVQALYHLTHALDRTRPVIGNDGWELLIGDIHGIHDYSFSGRAISERYGNPEAVEHTLRDVQPQHHMLLLSAANRGHQPVMITEFGGLSYQPGQGEAWFGYGTVRTQAEFEQKYAELITAIASSPTIAGFCYTQLTDTG
ncbi:MAG: beta-galactosidase/beta-glucuronidase, partial [Chloroflexi bacterium]|nr:beta-galactosidase/beta-glucuronidase [Chloroflexota bacterium]